MYLRVLSLVAFVFLTGIAFGQKQFVFSYQQRELEEVENPTDVKKSILGDDIANKLQLMREMYTYQEFSGVTRTEVTIVEKSAIYNTTKKLVKHYEKAAKKGQIEQQDAVQRAESVVDIVLNIRYQNTQDLEAILWKTKDPEEIYDLYANNVSLEL